MTTEVYCRVFYTDDDSDSKHPEQTIGTHVYMGFRAFLPLSNPYGLQSLFGADLNITKGHSMSKILQTVIILTAIIVFYPVSQTVAADEQKSILITGASTGIGRRRCA